MVFTMCENSKRRHRLAIHKQKSNRRQETDFLHLVTNAPDLLG